MVIRAALLLAGLASLCLAPAPARDAELRLVWSDEFDREGRPDPRNWTFERGFVRHEEAQYYQPENARVENGLLVIEARRERRPNDAFAAGSADWRTSRPAAEYTSACLTSRGLH